MIRFNTLGSLDLRAEDGRQVRSVLAQPKRIALLAYLAACGSYESHRRDKLLGIFWPDLDEPRARRALNQALYVLRRALGANVFVSTRDEELALAREAVWCDVAAFLGALEEGRDEDALELYRGDLLEGFFISDAPEFEKWLDAERDGLRKRAADAAWVLAEREEANGAVDAAADWARRAAGYALLDEGSLRKLLRLLDRIGDRAAAVRAYEQFSATLERDLSVRPSPETQELIAAIRSRESAIPAPETPAESATAQSVAVASAASRTNAADDAEALDDMVARAARPEAAPQSATVAQDVAAMADDAMAIAVTEGREDSDGDVRRTRRGRRPSVAVLPFIDVSSESEHEYFADGMAEELIAALDQVEGLRVAARTSSFSFKGAAVDVRAIGKQLNVDAVVEGSVRKRGDRVRIRVQLVNVEDGFHVWSEVYDRELADIFSVQEEIARSIVDRLKAELLGEVDAALVRRRTRSFEAFTDYLKGRYLWNRRTEEDLRASIDCFEQAIAADPSYAQAYAGLADAYSLLGWYRHIPAQEAYARVKEAAEKALELDESTSEACTSHAYAMFLYEWEFDKAGEEFRRAIELNPGYPTLHQWYAEYLYAMGRPDRAEEEMALARSLDPLSLSLAVADAWSMYLRGDSRAAITALETIQELDPQFEIIPWFLGPAYVHAGRYEDALALYEARIERAGEQPGLIALLAQAQALAGRRDEAEAAYARLGGDEFDAPVYPDYRAIVATALGDADRAFESLDEAFEERCWVLAFLKIDPAYEALRSDPRFTELVARIGLPA